MVFIQKRLWLLFYIIAFVGLITVSIISYNLWTQLYDNNKLKQENITKISASSTNSLFEKYETILDILGTELLKNKNYKSIEKSTEILDSFLKLNDHLAALAVVNRQGYTFLRTSNVKDLKLPNLLEQEVTKDSFLETMDSNSMVLGRSYYHKILKSLVIPIRKTLRDEMGNIIGVLVAGINIEKGNTFFNKQLEDAEIYEVALFRDVDNYFQLLPVNSEKNLKFYNEAFPNLKIEKFKSLIESNYKYSLDYFKDNEKVFTFVNYKGRDGRAYITSLQYLSKYKQWVIIQSPYTFIKNMFFETFMIILLVYIIIAVFGYELFKYILNFEEKKNKELYYQATHDYLTNLHNRMYLSKIEDKLTQEDAKFFSLFFIDMDNFKSINDNYGHVIGDKLLKEIASRLQYFSKENDVLIRYSGDEFILIVNIIEKEKVCKLAEELLSSLSTSYKIEKYSFTLGASIGISQFPKDAGNIDKIKAYADLSMYEAKKTKNTYCIFEDSIKNKYFKANEIEHQLQTALSNNEFFMMYQPQINKDGSIYGVEALIRWKNEKLGFVSPEQFISIVEDTGFMPNLGKFIVETSLKEIKNLQKELNLPFHLSINISVKQFLDVNFYDYFLDSIKTSKFDEVFITLEITENIFIEDIDFILELLNKFKKQKFKISLDDFGTGYSSLSLLKKLPIDELKIDKSFVDDILHDDNSRNMIKSILSMSKSLGFYVVAEGIETKEQKDLLKVFNCDIFQGYYYSKPLKIDDLKTYIKNFDKHNS